ncbi:uncharacterized protein [Antedon mediterranea]|uniref:uncharacterized protein n=1 Tax=Antedon mediterranea TaxID=105859 RepID=UPI003AF85F79
MAHLVDLLVCFMTLYPVIIVSIEIELFNTTVEFSGNDSCFSDPRDRSCECDQFCIKHQECCLDYEIWLSSTSVLTSPSLVTTNTLNSWLEFFGAVKSNEEEKLDLETLKPTFREIENLIMSRKENLDEFSCNALVVDCRDTFCYQFKILTIQTCDKMFSRATKCGDGGYDLVYDSSSELVYRNRECAICNFVEPKNIIPFVKMVDAGNKTNLTDEDLKNKTPKAKRAIRDEDQQNVLPPTLKTYSKCQSVRYACEVEISEELSKACLAYQGITGCSSNPHCEKCSDPSTNYGSSCPFVFSSNRITKPSFAIFIDSSGGLTRVYPTNSEEGPDDNVETSGYDVILPTDNSTLFENYTETPISPNMDTTPSIELRVTAAYSDVAYVITLIGTILSIISILIALLTFYVFPVMRNTSGWINILLLLSILTSCVLYMFLLIDKAIPIACRAVAIAKHFTLLCTFCWINCLGFNIFLSTKPKPVFSKTVQKKFFIYYCVYSALIPSLIVSGCIAVEYLSIQDVAVYEYYDCFLSGGAKLWVFILPISVMMLLNAIMFVIIIINIKKKSYATEKQSAEAKKKRHRFEIILSVKIFCAFALYWIFGILANTIVIIRQETTILSLALTIVFVSFSSLQGVFVCIALVFNKRVIEMWKKKLRRKQSHEKLEQV